MDFGSLLDTFPSRAEVDLLIKEIGDSREMFGSLLDLALAGKDPVAWRAAWIADGLAEQHPGLAAGRVTDIVRRLPGLQSKGTLRSMLRLLCRYEIPEEEQGILIDLCFGTLASERYPVAVKVHAMQIIYNHVLLYPELKGELTAVIEDQMDNNSVGFSSRARRLIRQMERL